MNASWMTVPALHCPWLWPQFWQRCVTAAVFLLGAAVGAGADLGDAWFAAERSLQTQHETATRNLLNVQQKMADTLQQQQQVSAVPLRHEPLPLLLPRLTAAAQAAGVKVVSMQVAQSSDHMPRLHWHVRGETQALWRWLQHLSQQHVALVLLQLDMQAGVAPAVDVQGVWRWPMGASPEAQSSEGHASPPSTDGVGFDSAAWGRVQHEHAARHPSYVQWVLPELQRPRQALEQYPLSALRYEGRIFKSSSPHQVHALVRIADPSAALQPVVHVTVGAYVGPDFGKVQEIAADHVLLREVWRDEHGVWAPRWQRLPLAQAQAALASTQERP